MTAFKRPLGGSAGTANGTRVVARGFSLPVVVGISAMLANTHPQAKSHSPHLV